MLRLLILIILIPILIVFSAILFANREVVTFNLDPLNSSNPLFSIDAPLYLIALSFMIFGIILGAVIDWLKQGKYRKELRTTKKQFNKLSKETERLKDKITLEARNTIENK